MTQEIIKELFEYKYGHFYWKIPIGKKIKIGQIAGTTHSKGYRQIKINGKVYFEHRIIWLYHNGLFPKNQIDHINGFKDDNRIENLREATNGQNKANTPKKTGLSSRFKGVFWHKAAKKWNSSIRINRKTKHLGTFSNEIDAAIAYNEEAIKHFGEFALINKI